MNMSNIKRLSAKIDRLQRGASPRLLDLFAGCGGISLGFHASGFVISGAVEIDSDAAKSHALNFHGDSAPEVLHAHSKPWDITKTEPAELALSLGFDDVPNSIDVIVGGPPCQAFARVGRAKLREIDAHPEAYVRDPRGNLYLRYLHYVRAFQPLALLMENVPDILNYGGHNIAEEITETLEEIGYTCQYTLLNSVHYGVPQMRERMFLVAFIKELNPTLFFPKPTHFHELPRGYHGTRQVALQTLINPAKTTGFAPTQLPSKNLKPSVTAEEAIGDLPPITLHLEGKLKRGTKYLTKIVSYPSHNHISPYACLMRTWKGFESSNGIFDHVIRYLPRDYDIFQRMNPGDQYPEAHNLALRMLDERLLELQKKGICINRDSEAFKKLYDSIVPPYDPGKFPNKWRKMEPDQPARTLLAHLGKDGYSHIHYDSNQKRCISVREAARLQSFPDGFRFCGTMNPAFRQIGNAVPPLVARAFAETIKRTLLGEVDAKTSIEEIDGLRFDLFQMAL